MTSCRVMRFSRSYGCRLFKQHLGMPFLEKLREIRIARAERLIAETPMYMKEIAAECGFSSPNRFFEAFRRIHGISPSNIESEISGRIGRERLIPARHLADRYVFLAGVKGGQATCLYARDAPRCSFGIGLRTPSLFDRYFVSFERYSSSIRDPALDHV